MRQSRRVERTGRRPVIAVPFLLALTAATAIFTLALVAGADGRWRPIHFIFLAVTVLTAGIAGACVNRRRPPKALDPDLIDPELMRRQSQPHRASTPAAEPAAPAAAAAPETPLTGTIVGTNVQVEVGQPAAS